MTEVIEWLAAMQFDLEARETEDKRNKIAELEQTKSLLSMLDAMDQANEALQRMQQIGEALFDERDADSSTSR